MKTYRALLVAGVVAASLLGPAKVAAQTPTPPVVVPADPNGSGLLKNLKGAPAVVKDLILSFDKTANQYLAQQRALLQQYKNATTPEAKAAIRDELQDNRAAFLAELKTFRAQLKDDLAALKGKLGQGELQRILAAAHDATPVGDRHKGAH